MSGTTSYELTVAGELDGGLHSEVTVTVNVTDLAEAPAFFGGELRVLTRGERGRRREQCSVGRGIATADPENVDVLPTSIEAGDSGGAVRYIDSGTGALSYQGDGCEAPTSRWTATSYVVDGAGE